MLLDHYCIGYGNFAVTVNIGKCKLLVVKYLNIDTYCYQHFASPTCVLNKPGFLF